MRKKVNRLAAQLRSVFILSLTFSHGLHFFSAQVSELSEQNNALRKNISCLFKTARLELARKSAAITTLEKR